MSIYTDQTEADQAVANRRRLTRAAKARKAKTAAMMRNKPYARYNKWAMAQLKAHLADIEHLEQLTELSEAVTSLDEPL